MRRSLFAFLLLCGAAAIGCHDEVVPISGVPTPAPTPTPTPVPTPTPALGTGLACGLPARPECGGPEGPPGIYGCCKNEVGGNPFRAEFMSKVDEAIDILMGERPDIFRGEEVLDRIAYVNGVARVLEQRFRLCAKPGQPGDEVAVKNSNSYNEQFDIYLSNARIRRQGFVASCQPARF